MARNFGFASIIIKRLVACAFVSPSGFTLLAVVRKPADRPAVAAYINRDLPRIQEWCNHWCIILNPNKTKALVVSRSRTVNPPHGDLVMSRVSIRNIPNLDILFVKFDSKITFKELVWGIVSRVSQRIGILKLVKRIFVDTSVLLRCYFAFVLPILEYCSPVWGCSCWMSPSASWAPGVFSASLCSDQSFLSDQLIHWSLKCQGVEPPNLQGVSCRHRLEWGRTFPTLCLIPERWMGSRVQSTVGCFLGLCFIQLSVAQVLVGLRKQFKTSRKTSFSPLGPVCWF